MSSITRRDFDRAVAQPWSPTTCLIAQTTIRLFGKRSKHRMYKITGANPRAEQAMADFDDAFYGDKNNRELTKLRNSLPIRIKI